MKANELRINSILSNAGGKLIKCTAQTISDFESGLIILRPVKLTEEWLLKCGFVKIENNWKTLDLGFSTISWERLAGIALSFKNESIYLPHIKHLHQLQNLYFALTGEELNIEL